MPRYDGIRIANGRDAGKYHMAKIPKLDNALYEAELNRLQTELVEMQEWVKATGARIVVLFEGCDSKGFSRL